MPSEISFDDFVFRFDFRFRFLSLLLLYLHLMWRLIPIMANNNIIINGKIIETIAECSWQFFKNNENVNGEVWEREKRNERINFITLEAESQYFTFSMCWHSNLEWMWRVWEWKFALGKSDEIPIFRQIPTTTMRSYNRYSTIYVIYLNLLEIRILRRFFVVSLSLYFSCSFELLFCALSKCGCSNSFINFTFLKFDTRTQSLWLRLSLCKKMFIYFICRCVLALSDIF